MKRAVFINAIVFIFTVWPGPVPAVAQKEQAPRAEPSPGNQATSQIDRETMESTGAQPMSEAQGNSRERNRARLVDRLNRVRKLMTDELQLSARQCESIGELFDAFVHDTLDPKQTESTEDLKNAEMRDLRKRIFEARKTGDNARATALRSQWVQLRYAEMAREEADLARFLADVEAKLERTQRNRFRRLVDRAGLHPRSGPVGNTLATLTRTLRHPSLELSGEQQATILRIIREEIQAVPRDERRDRGMDAAVPAIRKRVMGVLLPAQQSRFAALFEGAHSGSATEKEPETPPSPATDGAKTDANRSDND